MEWRQAVSKPEEIKEDWFHKKNVASQGRGWAWWHRVQEAAVEVCHFFGPIAHGGAWEADHVSRCGEYVNLIERVLWIVKCFSGFFIPTLLDEPLLPTVDRRTLPLKHQLPLWPGEKIICVIFDDRRWNLHYLGFSRWTWCRLHCWEETSATFDLSQGEILHLDHCWACEWSFSHYVKFDRCLLGGVHFHIHHVCWGTRVSKIQKSWFSGEAPAFDIEPLEVKPSRLEPSFKWSLLGCKSWSSAPLTELAQGSLASVTSAKRNLVVPRSSTAIFCFNWAKDWAGSWEAWKSLLKICTCLPFWRTFEALACNLWPSSSPLRPHFASWRRFCHLSGYQSWRWWPCASSRGPPRGCSSTHMSRGFMCAAPATSSSMCRCPIWNTSQWGLSIRAQSMATFRVETCLAGFLDRPGIMI